MMTGAASSGRMIAVYQRPCSARMTALALLRASISAKTAARATSTACAPCALAAASVALYASRKPLMIGAVRNCASHCSMGAFLFQQSQCHPREGYPATAKARLRASVTRYASRGGPVAGIHRAARCAEEWVPAFAGTTSFCSAASLLLGLEAHRGAGDEAQQDHQRAHDHHDAPGALGAEQLRPVEHLGLVEHAKKLGGVGNRDGLEVAAERAQPRARAFECGAHLGDGGVPPRQAAQTRQEEPVIESEGDDHECENDQHVNLLSR